MTSSQQRQLSKLIRSHKSAHVIHATRVAMLSRIYNKVFLKNENGKRQTWKIVRVGYHTQERPGTIESVDKYKFHFVKSIYEKNCGLFFKQS